MWYKKKTTQEKPDFVHFRKNKFFDFFKFAISTLNASEKLILL